MAQVKAIYDFIAEPNSGKLSISVDEILTVVKEGIEGGWLEGRNSKGQHGLFPETYVVKLPPTHLAQNEKPPVPTTYALPPAENDWPLSLAPRSLSTEQLMSTLALVGVNCINAKRIANKVARLTDLVHARLRKTSILEMLATIADLVDDKEFAKIIRSNIEVNDASRATNEDLEQELADEVDYLNVYEQNAKTEADHTLAKELHDVCCAVQYVSNIAIFKSSVISRAHDLPEKFINKMNALQKERDESRSELAKLRKNRQDNEKQWKTMISDLEKKLQSQADDSNKNIDNLNQKVKELQDKLAKAE